MIQAAATFSGVCAGAALGAFADGSPKLAASALGAAVVSFLWCIHEIAQEHARRTRP
jgi:hypothetical protein